LSRQRAAPQAYVGTEFNNRFRASFSVNGKLITVFLRPLPEPGQDQLPPYSQNEQEFSLFAS
jgi:hypothetical protein